MNEDLRRRYVRDLILDLQQVGGARLEQLIRPFWDHLAGGPVIARGLNVEGAPVGDNVDAVWPDGSVSEASSDAKYFVKPYSKPNKDLRHALKLDPTATRVRLFSTRTADSTAMAYFKRRKTALKLRGIELDVWDGRRIAEYIVDKLLIDERFVARVGDALPNLRRISEQNAASARVPALDPLYGGRADDEDVVLARLNLNKALVLFGLGGIGKTELACAIAHRERDKFELAVWVDGEGIAGFEQLRAFDIRLNGYRLNVLGLLSLHKTLLILDNIGVDLDVNQLAGACNSDSRVLITSRVEFGTTPVQLGFVGRERTRQIISAGVQTECPDHVLDAILATVDGHPLVLRMLNQFSKEGHDWDLVKEQCLHIVGAPDEKRQTVARRILERHLDVLGGELAFFAWCGSATVDRDLFEAALGLIGREKLQRWGLIARGQSDAIRLHDVVFESVKRLVDRLPVESQRFESALETYLCRQISPKSLGFFRVVNRHRGLIEGLLTISQRPGVLRYAYLHGRPASQLTSQLIGDPDQDANLEPRGDRKAWVLSIVESIEVDYRRTRDLGDKANAKEVLRRRLQIFDRLLANNSLSDEEREIVRHHKGKSLLKVGQEKEALKTFQEVAAEPGNHYATKLQIARLSENDPEFAKSLIFEIIDAEYVRPGSVSMSVLLETLGTLRRRHLRQFVDEVTSQYGKFMCQQIKAAACSGEDQPIHAFAGVGPDWSYKHPELFLEVLQEIELGLPEDAEDDDERLAIARLLVAAGKMLLRQGNISEAMHRFTQSITFFETITRRTCFVCTHYADALLRLGRASEAAEILDSVESQHREAYWLLRRTEAHCALKEFHDARKCIEKALDGDLHERRSTFLAQYAEVLASLKDPTHEMVLRQAIEHCDNDHYRRELEGRLAAVLK
jgi:tetratricopeptide (TPR) repeat protein